MQSCQNAKSSLSSKPHNKAHTLARTHTHTHTHTHAHTHTHTHTHAHTHTHTHTHSSEELFRPTLLFFLLWCAESAEGSSAQTASSWRNDALWDSRLTWTLDWTE